MGLLQLKMPAPMKMKYGPRAQLEGCLLITEDMNEQKKYKTIFPEQKA